MIEPPRGSLHLLEDPEFKELTTRKDRISFLLTAATMLLYYGFIFLIAFKRSLFAVKIAGNVTLGIVLGIAVILSCWLLTGIYVRWANEHYDARVAHLKEKAGHGGT